MPTNSTEFAELSDTRPHAIAVVAISLATNIGLDEDPARIQNSGVLLQSQYTSLNQVSRLQNVSEDSGNNVSLNASQSSQYVPLHPWTRSWEVPRQHATLEKIIGKGAFGQVAKGTAIDLRGWPGKTLVAIKKLKGAK